MMAPMNFNWHQFVFALVVVFATLNSPASLAAGKSSGKSGGIPTQGRFFVGVSNASPSELNDELTNQGLRTVDFVTRLGAEVLFPIGNVLDIGLRYTKRYISRDELTSNPATNYEATLEQNSVGAIIRLPIIKSTFFWLDVYGLYGGTNTFYKIKTASQDGQLNRQNGESWLATPYSAYGGSVAIGYKNVYVFGEAGLETNKVDNFTRIGTINGNVNKIDLTGSYFTVGLIFDGVGGSSK